MDAWGLESEAVSVAGRGIDQVGSGQVVLVVDRDLGSSPGQGHRDRQVSQHQD